MIHFTRAASWRSGKGFFKGRRDALRVVRGSGAHKQRYMKVTATIDEAKMQQRTREISLAQIPTYRSPNPGVSRGISSLHVYMQQSHKVKVAQNRQTYFCKASFCPGTMHVNSVQRADIIRTAFTVKPIALQLSATTFHKSPSWHSMSQNNQNLR